MSGNGNLLDHPRDLTLAEWQQGVEASVREALDWLPDAALERIARQCLSRSGRRRRRLARRDAALLALAEHYCAESGRALGQQLARDLALYRGAGRHRGTPPADARRQLLHEVINLSGGRALGWRAIFGVLAGGCATNSDEHDTQTRA